MPAINTGRVASSKPPTGFRGGGLTSGQKAIGLLAAIFCGPAVLKKFTEQPVEKVDLSSFNIVTHYDKPAIEKLDSTLRIEFCSSWQVNGKFRACAQGLQAAFPGLKVEGGPYTPPAQVQYAIRAVRVAQASAAGLFFFGEQLFASLRRPVPKFVGQMHENKLLAFGGVYALDVVAQTFKSINAFELTYNGQLLHSKLGSGAFPDVGDVVAKLRAIMEAERKAAAGGA